MELGTTGTPVDPVVNLMFLLANKGVKEVKEWLIEVNKGLERMMKDLGWKERRKHLENIYVAGGKRGFNEIRRCEMGIMNELIMNKTVNLIKIE